MNSIDTERQIKDLYNEVRMRLKQGQSEEEIVAVLEKKGLEPFYVRTMLSNIEKQRTERKLLWFFLALGIACCLAAATIMIASLQTSRGNYIIVPFGLAGIGGILVVRVFVLYRR